MFQFFVEKICAKLIHRSIREMALGDVWELHDLMLSRGCRYSAYTSSVNQLLSLMTYSWELQQKAFILKSRMRLRRYKRNSTRFTRKICFLKAETSVFLVLFFASIFASTFLAGIYTRNCLDPNFSQPSKSFLGLSSESKFAKKIASINSSTMADELLTQEIPRFYIPASAIVPPLQDVLGRDRLLQLDVKDNTILGDVDIEKAARENPTSQSNTLSIDARITHSIKPILFHTFFVLEIVAVSLTIVSRKFFSMRSTKKL